MRLIQGFRTALRAPPLATLCRAYRRSAVLYATDPGVPHSAALRAAPLATFCRAYRRLAVLYATDPGVPHCAACSTPGYPLPRLWALSGFVRDRSRGSALRCAACCTP